MIFKNLSLNGGIPEENQKGFLNLKFYRKDYLFKKISK